jgi:hypothetical protein
MSDQENPQDDRDPDRHERFEELSPSGRVRTRRRKHSGPYNAPIPEAADINSLRINWQSDAARLAGQPGAALGNRLPTSEGGGSDRATLEHLVHRLAEELKADSEKQQPNSPNSLRHGEHPADKIPPPLPASIAVLNQPGTVDKSTGKRKRKREHGSGGRRHCPFCNHNRALHIRPANVFGRFISVLGIRTYSCRNCRSKFQAFAFIEGPYFTWRQVGILGLILLIVALGFALVYPLINRVPDLVDY